MDEKTYNFQDPTIRATALKKSAVSARPKTYCSKCKIVEEAQREIIRVEMEMGSGPNFAPAFESYTKGLPDLSPRSRKSL